MGTHVEQIFKTDTFLKNKILEPVPDDTFSYMLSPGKAIWRCGKEVTTGLKMKGMKPTFFGPQQVAVLYGDVNKPLSRWETKTPLRILVISDETIESLFEGLWKLLTSTESKKEDYEAIENVFRLFGHSPYKKDDPKYKQWMADLYKWIEKTLKDEPALRINSEYQAEFTGFEPIQSPQATIQLKRGRSVTRGPATKKVRIAMPSAKPKPKGVTVKISPKVRSQYFTRSRVATGRKSVKKQKGGGRNIFRLSSSSTDFLYLKQFLDHPYDNEELRRVLNKYDGIYVGPSPSGFHNKYNFITLLQQFHEELFILPKHVGTELLPTKVIPLPGIYPEAFRITGLEGKGPLNLENPAFVAVPDAIEDCPEEFCLLHKYIYSFNRVYETVSSAIERKIADIFNTDAWFNYTENYIVSKDECTRWIKDHAQLMHKKYFEILLIVYKVLEEGFIISPQLFVDVPENPFESEELFVFTCLSDALKAGVRAISGIYNELDLKFIPISSGGILFSQYTYGKYRRQTKDIDLKIVEVAPGETLHDLVLQDKAGKIIELEHTYTRLTLTNVFCMKLLQSILSEVATGRFACILKKYNKDVFQFKNDYETIRKKIGFTDRYSLTTVRDLDKLVETIMYRYDKDYHASEDSAPVKGQAFFGNLNDSLAFLGKEEQYKPFDTIVKFTEQRKQAFKDRKTGNRERAREILKITEKLFRYWLKHRSNDNHMRTAMKIYDHLLRMNVTRPSLNPFSADSYAIGGFGTVWINVGKESYGLVDFTFDSDYSLAGTYTYPSGQSTDAITQGRGAGMFFGSFYDFLINTSKLKKICDATYYGAYSKCSPNQENAAAKQKKYNERYQLVLNFCKDILGPILEIYLRAGSITSEVETAGFLDVDSLDEILRRLKTLVIPGSKRAGWQGYFTKDDYDDSMDVEEEGKALRDAPFTNKMLSIFLSKYTFSHRTIENMIGAGRPGVPSMQEVYRTYRVDMTLPNV